MPLEPGSIVGDYRVLGILGEGGMGQVYKVQNLLSNRVEALKILLPDLIAQPQQLERFLREIQVQASLVHPNIASLYTASRLDNRLLMFMELVDGETLAARLSGGPVAVDLAVNITTQVLNALAYAHERGVVHRDIKPSNIMLTTAGVAKLLDFGLATARGDRSLTGTGSVLGSLHYMSPEQVRGAPATPASDIYSLGLTVYEMLTGRRGIAGPSDYAVMTAHLHSMPEPPVSINPAVPETLSQIVLKAVAKDPPARFGSALEFKAALDQHRPWPAAATPAPSKEAPVAAPEQPVTVPPPTLSTQTLTPPPRPVPPMPDLSPRVPMQSLAQPSSDRVTPAPAREARHASLALIGTVAGAAVLLVGGALWYWPRETRPPATPAATSQPALAAPSEPVLSQPPAQAPAVQAQNRAPQRKTTEKRLPAPAETTKETAPSTPVASNPPAVTQPIAAQPVASPPAASPPAATPPPAAAPPAATPPPAPVNTAQQQQAEEWARVSSRDPAQIRQFLAAHPDGPFAVQAASLLADFEWQTLRGTGQAAALREFAARYPASSHSPEALDRAAQLDARQAVLQVIARFQDAVSARDLTRVRGLWPSASADTISRVTELFKNSRTVTLTLRPQAEMRLVSDRAEVSCQEHLVSMEGSKPRTIDSTARVRLVKSGGAWTIDSIVSTPPSLYNPF